jgi:cold shock protein
VGDSNCALCYFLHPKLKKRRRKDMEETINKASGIVKSFNPIKGYGFISCEEDLDKDIYVHFTQIIMDGKRTLNIGDKVEFLYKNFEDKGLRAYQVKKVD